MTYGYIRTSRQRIEGTSGSDPASQARQLHQDGVLEANIFRDVGVSGGTGTNSRAGWRALNTRLAAGDTVVVVAIDRIGRRWMDTVNTVRDLRAREVKIRSMAQSEATWVTYLDAEPDPAGRGANPGPPPVDVLEAGPISAHIGHFTFGVPPKYAFMRCPGRSRHMGK